VVRQILNRPLVTWEYEEVIDRVDQTLVGGDQSLEDKVELERTWWDLEI